MKKGVVMGYRIFTPERKDYQRYLDFVAEKIKEHSIEKLILCGGFTDPRWPGISEAASMKSYLISILTGFTNYILEEKSVDSNQNLAYAAEYINPNDEVFVYCDLIRLSKIAWIAAHFILHKSQEEIADIFLGYARAGKFIDINKPLEIGRLKIVGFYFPERKIDEAVSQYAASILDVIALYNENINKKALEARKTLFGLDEK